MCQIRQATVAFVFATLSSFKALLHDSASGLLEDWFQIFRMFLGGALHKESTCGVMDGPWSLKHLKRLKHVKGLISCPS